MSIYSTLHTFLHIAGDYLDAELHADLSKGGSTLSYSDVVCADFELYDTENVLKYSISSGNVYDDDELVFDLGEVVYYITDEFQFSTTEDKVTVRIKKGVTSDMLSGAYSIKLRLTFSGGEVLSFMYCDALQILLNSF